MIELGQLWVCWHAGLDFQPAAHVAGVLVGETGHHPHSVGVALEGHQFWLRLSTGCGGEVITLGGGGDTGPN